MHHEEKGGAIIFENDFGSGTIEDSNASDVVSTSTTSSHVFPATQQRNTS